MDRKATPYIALAVSIVLNAGALVCLRALVDVVAPSLFPLSVSLMSKVLSSWLLWAGGISFVASLYLWMHSLKTIPLSLAYPTAAMSYIVIAPIAWLLFDEPITIRRALGMAVIIIGVALLYHRRRPRGSA